MVEVPVPGRPAATLHDGDVSTVPRMTRRAALALAAAAPILLPREPLAQQAVNDRDRAPSGDPTGGGRCLAAPPAPLPVAGATDSDSGAAADRAGYGRGYPRGTHSRQTDCDHLSAGGSDAAGNGRGGAAQRQVGASDRDIVPPAAQGAEPRHFDPLNGGRGRLRTELTRVTDSDPPTVDPQNNGRGAAIAPR
jgi:hypothetical protein